MSNILVFSRKQKTTSDTKSNRKPTDNFGEIILFPGVRYERQKSEEQTSIGEEVIGQKA